MTKEEAIEEINKVFEPAFANYIITALTEGATASDKALEQEPCEDAISKQAIFKFPKKTMKNYFGEVVGDVVFIEDIKALPPVTPKQRWIPVSERVVKFPCLACDIFEQIFIPVSVVTLDNRCFDGKDFDFDIKKFLRGKEIMFADGKKGYMKPREIVAWMPLPKPYKVESEE